MRRVPALQWVALLIFAMAIAQPARSAFAQAPVVQTATLAVALEAQYRAALIRDRRLADDRELRLIADAEARMRDARHALTTATSGRDAAQTALQAARAEYVRLVDSVELREASARIEVEAFRAEVTGSVAQATPDLIAAYQEFADGDRASAWTTLEALLTARANARVAAARAVAAAEIRQLANLREIMRLNGEATVRDVLALLDQAAELDAQDVIVQVYRARLAQQLGDLPRARAAADAAKAAAQTDRERRFAAEVSGDVRLAAGELVEARLDFERALAITRRAGAGNHDWDREISVELVRVADTKRAQGDRAGARRDYEEALALRRSVSARFPDDSSLERDITISLSALADELKWDGEISRAIVLYREQLDIAQRLSAADPQSIVLQRDTVVALSLLGKAQSQVGDWAWARSRFEQAIVIARRLMAIDRSADLTSDTARVLMLLGEAQQQLGQSEAARTNLQESLTLTRQLAEADPTNAQRQNELAGALEQMGMLNMALRSYSDAERLFAESLQRRRTLLARDATSIEARYGVAVLLYHLGESRLTLNQGEAASQCDREALDIAHALIAQNPQWLEPRRLAAVILLNEAILVRADTAAAAAAYREALAQRRAVADAEPDNPQSHQDVASVMLRMAVMCPSCGMTWREVAATLEEYDRRGFLTTQRAQDALRNARDNAARELAGGPPQK